MSELEQVREIPNVITGELVREDDIPAIARYLRDVRAHESELRELKRGLEGLIVEHARKIGSKTLRFEGPGGKLLEAKIVGGPKLVWDVERLHELLEAGLPQERFNELVTVEHTFKVNTQVAKSIAASNPDYARIVEEARSYEPAPERVSVSS